jgi:3-oxoacyl-[acyl-carrier-protein] synthase II
MADRHAAITGLGVVTPLGLGADATFNALLEKNPGVNRIDAFKPDRFPCQIAAQLDSFSARKFVPKSYRKAVKVMARDIEIAVAAADMAFRDAGIVTKGLDDLGEPTIASDRLGCNIGAGLICTELDELGMAVNTATSDGRFDYKQWGEHGMNNLTPLWLLKYLPNMLSCHVTIIHGAEGPSNCITCGDASAQLAVAESALYLQRGVVDVAICGAAESKLNPMGLLRQGKLNRLCTDRNDQPATAVRPFDVDHAGTAIGEGGALLILEHIDHARNRDATIYAELIGCGAACDPQAIDVLRPTAGNLEHAIRRAMADAEITPDDVDMILTYGTGVPGEDAAEAAAWHAALGERAGSVPACSFTGATGSMFAGAGSVQLAIAAKAIQQQVVPPTLNFKTAAENCELNLAPDPRQGDIHCVITGAYTVGGQSGVCVLKRP